MTDLKYMDESDLKVIYQIIGVYESRMLNEGMYIPSQIKRAINHFKLSMSEIK